MTDEALWEKQLEVNQKVVNTIRTERDSQAVVNGMLLSLIHGLLDSLVFTTEHVQVLIQEHDPDLAKEFAQELLTRWETIQGQLAIELSLREEEDSG